MSPSVFELELFDFSDVLDELLSGSLTLGSFFVAQGEKYESSPGGVFV